MPINVNHAVTTPSDLVAFQHLSQVIPYHEYEYNTCIALLFDKWFYQEQNKTKKKLLRFDCGRDFLLYLTLATLTDMMYIESIVLIQQQRSVSADDVIGIYL